MKIKKKIPLIDQHDKYGFWGKFGGNFIPETLKKPVEDLSVLFKKLRKDKKFINERDFYFKNWVGAPTPFIKLEKLTNLIHHRGPNENGYFIDDKINLGFKRLSIIDLKNGKQPFESQNKRYVLAFNGEIYNYKYLRKILISKNIKLKTNSDTEVLVESLSNFGLDYINKMNGMFAFVLYDKKENCAYFFRDRLGIKPLFF